MLHIGDLGGAGCAALLTAAMAAGGAAPVAAAAEPPRPASTPGSLSGTSAGAASAVASGPARRLPARGAATAGSLSGGANEPDCAALRRRYLQSQACFAPYRLANGGLKPEAHRRCTDVPDPSPQCGPMVKP